MDVRMWVEEACKALVDHPDAVMVTVNEGQQNILIEVLCHPLDFGQMVGTDWRHFNGMRDVLNGVGGRLGYRYRLEAVNPEQSRGGPRGPEVVRRDRHR